MVKEKTKIKKRIQKEEKKGIGYEKQTKFAVFWMLMIIFIVILVYFLIQATKKFEYAGLEFEKVKEGDLNLYFAELPFTTLAGNVVYAPTYFREDPRKLERINITDLTGRGMKITKSVALSASPEIIKCEDSLLAATTLSLYLGKLGVKAIGATNNIDYAEENNLTYIDCLDTDKYTVLMFKEYKESRIMKAENCYIVNIADCEIMNVTERFMLGLNANIRGVEI